MSKNEPSMFQESNEANRPIKRGGSGTPKTENFLPRSCPRKNLRYEKETWPPGLFRLLLVEVLPGGEISKNGEYRKYSTPVDIFYQEEFNL